MSELARPVSRLEQLREDLPDAARIAAQFAVDNPGQLAVMLAGGMVAARIAVNLVQPRTPLQAVATLVVVNAAVPYLLTELVRRDVIALRFRDHDGCFITGAELLRADAADHVHPA